MRVAALESGYQSCLKWCRNSVGCKSVYVMLLHFLSVAKVFNGSLILYYMLVMVRDACDIYHLRFSILFLCFLSAINILCLIQYSRYAYVFILNQMIL